MANYVQPQVVINYISQRKKIIVNRNNQPSQLIIQTDYNLNETYNFQIVNAINQIVQFDADTYEVYGSYIDAKNQTHILFYTPNFVIRDNILSFVINTYTSQYMTYVKRNQTLIDFSIVAKKGSRTFLLLRDKALANPRAYIEGQTPTEIVYQNIFNADVPVSGAFGAGNNINLTQDYEGEDIASFAFGDTLSTNNANQFVIGYNNTPDATKAFIVANSGNIFTVDYEGNVEAGDFNVGAISATSITVSGEDLNQVIDDKVEYLSTSIDDKLSATEDWVTSTFITQDSATQTFNELEGDIGQISAFVSGLPTDIAAKADQTDLDEANQKIDTISGQVEYLSGAIDQNTSDIGDLNTAVGSKANQTDLEALSGTVEGLAETKADKTELTAYIEKSASGLFATSSQMTELSTYVQGLPTSDTTYTGVAPIVVDATTHEISLEGEVGQTYYAGTGLALDDQTNTFSLTGTVLSGDGTTIAITDNIISVIGGTGGEGKEYSAGFGLALSGEGLSTFVLTATLSSIENDAGFITEAALADYALKSELIDTEDVSGVVESMSATIIDGLATESFVTTQGYQTATNVSDYFASVSGDIVTAATGAITVPTDEQISGIASAVVEDLSTTIRSGLASTSDIPTTVAELTDAGNYALTSDIKTYQAGTGLALSSDNETFYLTGTVLQGDNTTIAINNNVISVIGGGSGGGGKVYQGVSGISVDNNPQIGQIALTAHIPDSAEISGIAEDVVEGLSTTIRTGLATTEQIPTTVAELTDSSDYALKTDLNDYIEKSVSGQFATSGELEALTQTVNGKADSSEIPTKLSDLQNDSQFATSGQVSAIVTGYVDSVSGDIRSGLATTSDISDMATQTWVGQQGFATSANVSAIITSYNYITSADIPAQYVTETELGTTLADYTKTADLNIPTNADISGIAEDVVEATSAAIVGTISVPTKTSDLTNDSDFATSAYVQEASGHAVDVATGWVNGKGYLVQADLNGYAQTSDIPTDSEISGIASAVASTYVANSSISAVGQLINDVGYTTGYVAGTGIDINNGVISCSVQGGSADVNTVYNMLSSANNNLTIGLSNNTILFTASGGGGGGSDITDVSDLNNDTGFITAADITNKQRVNTVNGNTITYDSAFEVFKTTYAVSAIVLNPVTALTSQIGNGEVATFEEWITLTGSGTTTFEVDSNITLIGEWPSQIDNTKTHVLVRRLVNNAGTITQYVSYAYNF